MSLAKRKVTSAEGCHVTIEGPGPNLPTRSQEVQLEAGAVTSLLIELRDLGPIEAARQVEEFGMVWNVSRETPAAAVLAVDEPQGRLPATPRS
jgi:hypothetical protein